MIRPHEHGFVDDATGRPFVPVGVNYAAMLDMVDYRGKPRRFTNLFGVDRETEADGLDEARTWIPRLGELGMNVVRVWIEPHDAFPYSSTRLDPGFADRFDSFLDLCGANGIFATVGMHMAGVPTGWVLNNFEAPHDRVLSDHLARYADRWGARDEVFSWTIVGEGQLPWYTCGLGDGWPAWLQYWYNDDLAALNESWDGECGVAIRSFADAPVPPRNIGACLGVDRVTYGLLGELPGDAWAGSNWRYDWRMYLEHVGARRVQREVAALRAAGAQQMVAVGANSWTFPNLPAGTMTMGYNPWFYLDSVDYLCQHHYPMPQVLPGGMGDPLDSDESMAAWLNAVEIMGRIYTSMGKPVVLEEWGWYGGGSSEFAGVELTYRTEAEQERYCNLMMERTSRSYSGWMYWMHRDMPHDGDLTACSGLYYADGRIKPWGTRYGQWANQLVVDPPAPLTAARTVELPMKRLMTDDRFHETWWHDAIHAYDLAEPLDFVPVFERRPMMDWPNDVRDLDILDTSHGVWAKSGGA